MYQSLRHYFYYVDKHRGLCKYSNGKDTFEAAFRKHLAKSEKNTKKRHFGRINLVNLCIFCKFFWGGGGNCSIVAKNTYFLFLLYLTILNDIQRIAFED